VVFNSAVLASNLACASGSKAGGFPMECKPPPKPPDHCPDKSRGSNGGRLFATLDSAGLCPSIAGTKPSAITSTAIELVKHLCIFCGISIFAPGQDGMIFLALERRD
jgi:hypothetical protein